MLYSKIAAVIVAATFLGGGSVTLAAKPEKRPTPRTISPVLQPTGGYDETSLLVRYKPHTSASDRASARHLSQAAVLHRSKLVNGLEHIGLAPGMTVERATNILSKLPFVDYAHPNYRIHLDQVPPDDEHYLEQWALNNTGQASLFGVYPPGTPDADIDWPEARTLATGSGVVVAVLDTGIDYRHSDLSPNVWLNDAEMNGTTGVDDDSNGYVDDIRGWDFVNNDASPLDGHGHGTMVAGIIAAVTDNTKGIAGIMANGRVMALKVLDDNGEGLLSDAILGLEYAVANGARISNNSWGYSEILPEELAQHNALYDAILASQADDHLLVAAAGNDSTDTDITPHYPSAFDLDNILSVGATDNFDALAWFSSFGTTSVDIAAPGDFIFSTHKLFAGQFDDYAWNSGTSFSTPHVSGVAGLILELQPNWSYQQLKDRILTTARTLPGLSGTSATGGVLNMYTAVNGLQVLDVGIDVLPGDPANQIYPNQAGNVPVAVLGSAEFDATQVDPATLKFGAGEAAPAFPVVITDADGAFGLDTQARFSVGESGIACNDTEVNLSGSTYAGDQFTGSDSIDATQCQAGGCHAY